MWKETILKFSAACEFADPAHPFEIEKCEKQLGLKLPSTLQSLLRETNGVYDSESAMNIAWDVEEIARENRDYRTNPEYRDLYMPFDHLIFFAGAGNGDLFAFTLTATKQIRDDIFVWNHEDDSRTWVAPDLKTYFEWWLSGQIQV